MRTDKFSKTNLILYSCGLIPVIWFGLLVAPYVDGGIVDIIKNLSIAFSNPFNISICEDSLKTVLVFIMAYALGIGIYISNDKNYRRREEHGSAIWRTTTFCISVSARPPLAAAMLFTVGGSC